MMLIYGNEQIWAGTGPEEFGRMVAEVDAFNAALRASGELVAVDGLLPQPRSIRAVAGGGVPVVTDGPYLEAKEHVGSYVVVDVASEERALGIASSYPCLRYGKGLGGVEVWPVMEHGATD
ncbi:YciI family protein [Motilibacter aurantiacus]|uniref:YciI family protein n=1 Tax=Motilibacter aurantiacus TaxID=2714955 RepID=UPI001E5CE428|nr:YciI family protein [Motilibacter aurantiacus]